MLDANLAHSKRVMLSPGALSRTQAWKAMRASAEASQPNGRVYTLAESWAIQPTPERLFFLVEEQYDNLPDDVHVRLVTSPSPVLAVHDKRMGFMFEGPAMESAINKLLTLVRAAVSAVDPDDIDEEELDRAMKGNLSNRMSNAGRLITHATISTALTNYLQLNMDKTLQLDAGLGLLNMRGGKVMQYDRAACTFSLVDRDPNRHHVHRSTRVDGPWLGVELSLEMQNQYNEFKSEKLERWIIDQEARQYFLCLVGDALFSGNTTKVKKFLLLIGDHDQSKTTLLDCVIVAAGGALHEEGLVDTSGCYGYAGGNPTALGSKGAKDVTTSLYQTCRGVRLFRFNEFTSGDVWTGIKKLGNAEQVSYTNKSQSSGRHKEYKSGTPLAMGSCNLKYRPSIPTDDALTKVAVLTPSMLGRFVDRDADLKSTFPKVAGIDCNGDGVRPSPSIRFRSRRFLPAPPPFLPTPLSPLPSHATRQQPTSAHAAGSNAARHDGGAAGARQRAPTRAVWPRAPHAAVHAGRARQCGHVGRGQCRREQQRRADVADRHGGGGRGAS